MKNLIVVFLVTCLWISACTPINTETPAPISSPVEIAVSAAASLTEAYTKIGQDFEAVNPGIKVIFNFAGSQALAEQINNGAPVDVFASASQKTMQTVVDAGNVPAEAVNLFISNQLVVIVPSGNPGNVETLQDLTREGLKIVLAAKEVPVGQYSLEFLTKAAGVSGFPSTYSEDVLKNVVSYEDNVKAVLTKISLGEADAGIVYTTDAASAKEGTILTINIPFEINIPASYFIALVKSSAHPAEAQLFINHILSDAGQSTLSNFGFIPVNE